MTEPQKDALEALGRTWAVLAQIQNAAQRAGHSSEGARLAPRLGQLLEQPQSALTTAMTRATRAWIPRLNGLGNLLYERLIEAHAACGDVPSRLTAAQRAVVLHGFTAAETEDRRRRDDNTRSDPNNSNQKDPS